MSDKKRNDLNIPKRKNLGARKTFKNNPLKKNSKKNEKSIKLTSLLHSKETSSVIEENKKLIKNQHLLIYGTHAVNAALENPNRILKVLYVTPSRQEAYEQYCKKVKIQTLTKDEIDMLLPNSVHQGIALSSELKLIFDAQDFTQSQTPVIVLDNISDPQNVGAIFRSAAAFGVKHVVMQDRGAPDITGALAKAAAGAVESIHVHKVTNISRALEALKAKKFMVYGADGHSETMISDIKFSKKSVIVMGAEGSGLRRLVKENCDVLFKIPIADSVESLNVSNALAISLYALSASIN